MDLIADQLNFPTSLCFDDGGAVYVAESGLCFDGPDVGGRISRIDDGRAHCLHDGLDAPVNGLEFHEGRFYIAEGGAPGRISALTRSGERRILVDGLPGGGNYHTNMAVVGPDRKLYFSQGSLTNLGIVGFDGLKLAWLEKLEHACDIPGADLVLTGYNVETGDPRSDDPDATASTGAFAHFGTATVAGQRIPAALPCTAAVMRCHLDGSDLELVAWGIRNAYGLGFLPDGRLLATDQGPDDRGSRPIGNAPDLLFEVREGAWYGWPDFIGGVSVAAPRFKPTRGPQPAPLLANHDDLPAPERALLEFPVNAAATKFAVVPPEYGAWAGQLLVALFGDEKPMTAPHGPRVGRSLARIDPTDWSLWSCALGRFDRPIDVGFHPHTGDLYVVDFGAFEMRDHGVTSEMKSGRLWRIPRAEVCESLESGRLAAGPRSSPHAAESSTMSKELSFEADIRPLFEPYRGAMKWRFDLTNYEHVRANAEAIFSRISNPDNPMPPDTTGGFQPVIAARFEAWMKSGFKP